MDAGDLVPDELTTKMLIDEVNKHPDTNGILFDGYQEQFLKQKQMHFLYRINSNVAATIALEADDEILVQRLLEEEKQVVELIKMKKKIRNRYQEYNENTPLMDYYKTRKFYA
jgi:adenylate kinase